ncbi:hypothetical protein [Nocardia wallacei]|uniref:hypothetical protein n=1 Tax=Nocardia wallacei TaxID=480035 RepID=UPI002454EA08|nr:hypothetical protein [Nocardia wallacei]
MPTNEISPATYQSALSQTATWAADPLNKGDKAVWWRNTNRMLREHHGEPGAACQACGAPWPCGVVTGAIADVQAGSGGY